MCFMRAGQGNAPPSAEGSLSRHPASAVLGTLPHTPEDSCRWFEEWVFFQEDSAGDRAHAGAARAGPVLVKRFNRSERILGGLAGTIGAVSLLGWVLDVDILKSVVLGQATMKANTAVCFIVSGASLWISCKPSYGRVAHRLAKVSASIVAVAGLMSLSQYVFGVDLGIDQLLFQDTGGAVDLLYPGRMAANTATALMLVGLGLLLLDVSLGGRLWPSPVLAGVTGSLSLLVLTAYASGIISLFEVSEYAQMAMPTALAFLLVSLAIVLARPERGPMRLVSSDGAGGELARHLLPAAVGIPLVVGALRLLGQMQGLYDTYVGVWLFAIVTVVLITTLIWRFASSYEHAEHERKQIEETNRRCSTRRSSSRRCTATDTASRSRPRYGL